MYTYTFNDVVTEAIYRVYLKSLRELNPDATEEQIKDYATVCVNNEIYDVQKERGQL